MVNGDGWGRIPPKPNRQVRGVLSGSLNIMFCSLKVLRIATGYLLINLG